jgi:ABC-type Mn2+/Zn2+ transport system permease subunit
VFVVSGPSGAGKGTLIRGALTRIHDLAVAVSVTASVVGVLASFHLDIATAPLIVVLQGLAFVPAVLLSPRGRPVWRARA